MSHIALLDPAAALASLRSSLAGLAAAEVGRRQREYGANRVEEVARQPLWRALLGEFTHFFALILWLAAALAFTAEAWQPGGGMGVLGAAILLVIVVNGLFSFWQGWRAERALAALRELLPQRVSVRRAGSEEIVEAESLVPGDIVLLGEGDKVPADCRVLEAEGLRASLATLNGEARARQIEAGAVGDANPLAARNLLLAGTLLVAGRATALVFATGMHTEFGRIAHLTQTVGDAESPLQREIRRVSQLVSLLAGLVGILFFAIGRLIGLPFWDNFMFAIGIIVAFVPEGLLPTLTLSLAMATQRMARRNALVRHLPAVETLGSTTVICSDKTGTLTCNSMSVRSVFADDRELPLWAAPAALREVAAQCHDLRLAGGQWLGDPMELALWEFGGRAESAERESEQAFDADRRRMSVVVGAGPDRHLLCKGAPESVLPLCSRLWRESGTISLGAGERAEILAAQDSMANRGLRVLALASRALAEGEAAAEAGLSFLGLVGLEDPPRPDVAEAIERCHSAGIRVIMVTGDHPSTALAIAREIGLVRGEKPVVLRGESVGAMTRSQLQLALDAPELIVARASAEQKMLIVQALQRKGEIVAVTGDGVNDAPALKAADIGIAMGRSGTDVAKEAADLVLLDDHFGSIVNAVEEGRAIFENIRKFLTYILSSNITEAVPYLAFVLFRIPLPLTVIQILAVDLGTDMLPALALGAEAPHPDVMKRPPRPRRERLLSWRLVARAYLWLGLLEAGNAMAAYFFVMTRGGWHWGESLGARAPLYLEATTACLAAIVLSQVANLFVCRDPGTAAWRLPLRANPLLPVGICCELALLALIVFFPPLQALFGTAPLPVAVWLFIAPLASWLFLAEELRKAWLRR